MGQSVAAEELCRAHRRLCVDTAPLVYFLEGDPARAPLVEELLEKACAGELEIIVSVITEAELLVAPMRRGDPTLTEAVGVLLSRVEGLCVVEVSRKIAREAAAIRARHGLRLPDALVAATALESGCTALLSNDHAFERLDGIDYAHIDNLGEGTE